MKKYISIYQLELWGFEIQPDTLIYKLVANKGFVKAGYKKYNQPNDLLIELSNDSYDIALSKQDTYIQCKVDMLALVAI